MKKMTGREAQEKVEEVREYVLQKIRDGYSFYDDISEILGVEVEDIPGMVPVEIVIKGFVNEDVVDSVDVNNVFEGILHGVDESMYYEVESKIDEDTQDALLWRTLKVDVKYGN